MNGVDFRPGASPRKPVNLALQGGGAHGAFTWGALDRLLQEEGLVIEAITATSAGAMNAAALKHGWVKGGPSGAREALDRFWLGLVGLDGGIAAELIDWLRMVSPMPGITARALEFSPTVLAGDAVTRLFSPYQFNPTGYHPLRGTVEELVAGGTMDSPLGPRVFVAATNVRSGKPRIFMDAQVTTDAILASACLPTLYQAIEILDPATGRMEAYWDGGYIGNPALYPLHYNTRAQDLIIIHINPLFREELPRTSTEIVSRINEISFNASLLSELRTINFVNRLLDEGTIPEGRMKRNFVHSVSDDALMNQLGLASKMILNKALLLQLRDAGFAAMDRFIAASHGDIGVCSTIDISGVIHPDAVGA